MLGSLPSRYLTWVSKNLQARDSEEWAKLADQVLRDPIYRDRIEWELALNVLNGNSCSSTRPTSSSAVDELQEISESFGWDNLDKVGWAKIDFDLLGTSKGGRIPRLLHNNNNVVVTTNSQPPSTSSASNQNLPIPRMERRERQRMRLMRTQPQPQPQPKDKNISHQDATVKQDDNQNAIANPFPGRLSLLRMAINHRRHNHNDNT